MANQFSPSFSGIVASSRSEAIRLASNAISPEHLLLGIIKENSHI